MIRDFLKKSGLGLRVGTGMIPDVIVIPVEINGLAGKKKVLFEYGIGISNGIFLKKKSGNTTFPTGLGKIGFIGFAKASVRYQPQNKGITLNLNWTPVVNSEEVRWIWFGLGIGYGWRQHNILISRNLTSQEKIIKHRNLHPQTYSDS